MSCYESGIVVGKGWKESEHPNELYVACQRWTWCPDTDIAKLMYARAIRVMRGTSNP